MLSVSLTHTHTSPPTISQPLPGPHALADLSHTPVSDTHTSTPRSHALGIHSPVLPLAPTHSDPAAPNADPGPSRSLGAPARAPGKCSPPGSDGPAAPRPGLHGRAQSRPPRRPCLALGLRHSTTLTNPRASPRKPAALTRRTSAADARETSAQAPNLPRWASSQAQGAEIGRGLVEGACS